MRGVRCSAPLSSDLHPGGWGRGGGRGEGAPVSPSEALRGKRFLFIGCPRADGRATISGERGRSGRAGGAAWRWSITLGRLSPIDPERGSGCTVKGPSPLHRMQHLRPLHLQTGCTVECPAKKQNVPKQLGKLLNRIKDFLPSTRLFLRRAVKRLRAKKRRYEAAPASYYQGEPNNSLM